MIVNFTTDKMAKLRRAFPELSDGEFLVSVLEYGLDVMSKMIGVVDGGN